MLPCTGEGGPQSIPLSKIRHKRFTSLSSYNLANNQRYDRKQKRPRSLPTVEARCCLPPHREVAHLDIPLGFFCFGCSAFSLGALDPPLIPRMSFTSPIFDPSSYRARTGQHRRSG